MGDRHLSHDHCSQNVPEHAVRNWLATFINNFTPVRFGFSVIYDRLLYPLFSFFSGRD